MRNEIFRVFTSGFNGNGIRMTPQETVWDTLNAVTGYVDHLQQIKKGNRYAYIFFGKGAELKQKAWELLLREIPSRPAEHL